MTSRRRARAAMAVAATALAASLAAVGETPAGASARSSAGPGAVFVAPATAPAATGANTVRLAYVAPALGLSDGVVSVRIPPGWSAPQRRSPSRPGYVSSSLGTVRVAGRTVVVDGLDLCGGCTVAIAYDDARSPAAGNSTFQTRSAAAPGQRRRPLVHQPVVAVVAGAGSGAPSGGGGGSHGAASIPLGDYAGYVDPSGVARFGQLTGTHPALATDYLDSSDGWAAMDSASGLGGWGSGYRVVLAVPIIPASSGGTLAAGATGAYDTYFTTLARNLVDQGEADAIVRLGWEFNGDWFPWSISSNTDAENFAAYWRHIVTTMRAVAGQHFSFLWNPNNGSSDPSIDVDLAYPGNAYVDYVGTDTYDEYWGSPQTPENSWTNIVSESWGLSWLAGFAAAEGKPIAIPEWGVAIRSDGHGLGDDPYFVDQFAAWISTHDVAFTDIFSFDATSAGQDDDITDGNFPHALSAFEQDFG